MRSNVLSGKFYYCLGYSLYCNCCCINDTLAGLDKTTRQAEGCRRCRSQMMGMNEPHSHLAVFLSAQVELTRGSAIIPLLRNWGQILMFLLPASVCIVLVSSLSSQNPCSSTATRGLAAHVCDISASAVSPSWALNSHFHLPLLFPPTPFVPP